MSGREPVPSPTRGLARGSVLGIVAVGIERAISFLVVIYLARRLGRDAFGLWVFIVAGIAPLQVMADQGVEVAAIARMARRPHETAALMLAVLRLRLVLTIAAAIVAAVLLPMVTGDPATRGPALCGSLAVLVGTAMPIRSVLRARERLGSLARVVTLDALAGAVATVSGAAMARPVAAILVLRSVSSWIVTAGVAARAGVLGHARAAIDLRALVRETLPIATSVLLITLTLRVGHLAVMASGGAVAVAALGAAARLAEVLGLVADGVMQAVFPRMAAVSRDREAVAAASVRWLVAAIGWAVVAAYGAAPAACHVLLGPEYDDVVAPLRVLVWSGVFAATGTVILHGLVAAGHARPLLVANAAACALTIGLQAVLVPRWAVVGAAIATMVGTAAGQLFLGVVRESRAWVLHVWRAAFPAITAALGGTVMAATVPDGWRAVAVGSLAWAFIAWASGAIVRDDLVALRRLVGSRAS